LIAHALKRAPRGLTMFRLDVRRNNLEGRAQRRSIVGKTD
jgi:hypothetical protein